MEYIVKSIGSATISYKRKKTSLLEERVGDSSLTKCVDCTKDKRISQYHLLGGVMCPILFWKEVGSPTRKVEFDIGKVFYELLR